MRDERKITDHLLELLEQLNNNSNPSNVDENEDYFIAWMKVRYLTSRLKENTLTSPEIKTLAQNLQQRFKTQVLPRLTQFTKQVKMQDLGVKLNHVLTKLNSFILEAKQYLQTIPMESYEIYQNALYFLNLYRFAFPDPMIYKTAKRTVEEYLRNLQIVFQREAGTANLKKTQESLEQKLQSSLKGESPEIKDSVHKSPESSQLAQPNSQLDSSEIPTDNQHRENQDILSGVIEFPEESYETFEPDTTKEFDDVQILNQSRGNVESINSRNAPVSNLSPSNFQSVYSFHNWFPENNKNRYKSVLYCNQCGRLVSFQTEKCMGCAQNYHSIIKR